MAVKAWKRCFLIELGTSQPLSILFFNFVRLTIQPEATFLFLYLNDRAISPGHVQVKIYGILERMEDVRQDGI